MNPLDFTGERYIPGQGGYQLAYEHLHRYWYAMRWCQGKRVLDLACGSGYGAFLLALRARQVWALDLNLEALRYACENHKKDNLLFLRGDATQLPFPDGCMEVIVAMEVLEHVQEQEKLLREIARVCSDRGVVLISTPNRAEYSDARGYSNPFHKRELYLDEFEDLMKQHFSVVQIAHQQIRAGSLISCNVSRVQSEVIAQVAPGAQEQITQCLYLLAVCSKKDDLAVEIPAYSAYLDVSDGLFRETQGEMDRLAQWAKGLEDEIGQKDQLIQSLQNEMAREIRDRDQVIEELQAEMAKEVGSRDQVIEELQAEMAKEVGSRDQVIEELQAEMAKEITSRDQIIQNLQAEMKREIADRDGRILEMLDLLRQREKEFDERGVWALSLQAEVERLQSIRNALLYRVLSRFGLLPR